MGKKTIEKKSVNENVEAEKKAKEVKADEKDKKPVKGKKNAIVKEVKVPYTKYKLKMKKEKVGPAAKDIREKISSELGNIKSPKGNKPSTKYLVGFIADYLLYSDEFEAEQDDNNKEAFNFNDFLRVPNDVNGFLTWASKYSKAIAYFDFLKELPENDEIQGTSPDMYDIFELTAKAADKADKETKEEQLDLFALGGPKYKDDENYDDEDAYEDLNMLKAMIRMAAPVVEYVNDVLVKFEAETASINNFSKSEEELRKSVDELVKKKKDDSRVKADLDFRVKKNAIEQELADYLSSNEQSVEHMVSKFYNQDKPKYDQIKEKKEARRLEEERNLREAERQVNLLNDGEGYGHKEEVLPLFMPKYIYTKGGKDYEITKDEFTEHLNKGDTVTYFEPGRVVGTIYNPVDLRTGNIQKGETALASRNVQFSKIEHIPESLKELKALQKDLLATDPWYVLTNGTKFKELKKAVAETISAMDTFKKYPLTHNRNVLVEKMRALNHASAQYIDAKEDEISKNDDEFYKGNERDQKRLTVSKILERYSLQKRSDDLNKQQVHDTIEQLYRDEKNDELDIKDFKLDVANDIRRMKELQTDLLATDPWFVWNNSNEFRAIKASVTATIASLEAFGKEPTVANRKLLVEKTHTLMENLLPYIERKQQEVDKSQKSRDIARLDVARNLLEYANAQRITALARMDALSPDNVREKAEAIITEMNKKSTVKEKNKLNFAPQYSNNNVSPLHKEGRRVFKGLIDLHTLYKGIPETPEYRNIKAGIATAIKKTVLQTGPLVLEQLRDIHNAEVSGNVKLKFPSGMEQDDRQRAKQRYEKRKLDKPVSDADWEDIMNIADTAAKEAPSKESEIDINKGFVIEEHFLRK